MKFNYTVYINNDFFHNIEARILDKRLYLSFAEDYDGPEFEYLIRTEWPLYEKWVRETHLSKNKI
jgi:hypothetical protein